MKIRSIRITTRLTNLSTFAVAFMLLAGCQSLRYFGQPRPTAPVVFEERPSKEQLIAAIQQNTATVKQLNSSVRVVMDGMPAVSGSLILERPRRMRLKVGFLGMTDSGIDVGSNEELFWIWSKSSMGGQKPAVYYARHDEYANSQLQRNMQLQPQWIIEALGLVDLGDPEQIEGPFQRTDGRYEIRTTIPSAGGPMKRLTTVDPRYGWIVQQSIYDANNRLVVWANSTRYRHYPERQASLPQHIELHVYDGYGQEMTMAVQVLNHDINSLYVDPDQIWTMPNPVDVPKIDLARVRMQEPPQSQPPATEQFSGRDGPWTRPNLRGLNLK